MKPEEYNLKEEIKEIISKTLKTVVNENCAIFRVMREEKFSPIGKAIMLNSGFYDRIIYKCNLCKACEFNNNLCSAFQKARQVLVLQKKEPKIIKSIIKNLEESGNVYGVVA